MVSDHPSIFSFLSSTVVRLNTNYGMVRSFPHVGLYVFLGFEGHEICFVVTHLKSGWPSKSPSPLLTNPLGPTSESVRVSQTALLLEGLQKVTAGKGNKPLQSDNWSFNQTIFLLSCVVISIQFQITMFMISLQQDPWNKLNLEWKVPCSQFLADHLEGLIDWIASPNIADFNHPFQFQSAYSLYKHVGHENL